MTVKELIVIIRFDPLWETMQKKSISQYRLLQAGIDNKTLDGLKKNKNITLLTLEKSVAFWTVLPMMSSSFYQIQKKNLSC